VDVPKGVTVTVANNVVTAKGKLGEMTYHCPDDVETTLEGEQVWVRPKATHKQARQHWGTTRAQINNVVKGVGEGFTKKLELVGVGYKAQVQGKNLVLSLGYSHDITYPIPADLKIVAPAPTQVEVSGASKQRVGQVASELRGFRPPEPYKGKGVKYADERILRKEGKKK
jgi:large subunit ribosomal protein L6